MSLTAGTRIGSYTIVSALGAGGMGEVFRARDERLQRDVALKVLPRAVAADHDRVGRMRREAVILASLNHPNIAHIYGLEEAGDVTALVLELVPGETLAQHLTRGRLRLSDTLAIIKQIASALEAAHDLGIIHRDLKPANVMVADDGSVKVLDFGLAKATDTSGSSADATASPTISLHATEEGIILGTAAYMSPEQARGKTVDRRGDLWALGCVLFEMLTGKRAFIGEDATDTIVAVVSKEPDWSALPGTTPPHLRRLLRRCLDKRPKSRLDSAAAFRMEVEDLATVADSSNLRDAGIRQRIPWILTVVACTFALAASGLAYLNSRTTATPSAKRMFEIPIERLDTTLGYEPAISPSGSLIAYNADGSLWVRDLSRLEPQHLFTNRAESPAWFPDSDRVAYGWNKKIWTLGLEAGAVPVPVCDVPESGRVMSIAWKNESEVVFAVWRGSLYSAKAGRAAPELLIKPEPGRELDFHHVSSLPGNAGLLFDTHLLNGAIDVEAEIGGTRHALVKNATSGAYSSTGHLVYTNDAGLWSVAFSIASPSVSATPVPMGSDFTAVTLGGDGGLLAVRIPQTLNQLVWINRSGKVESTIGEPQLQLDSPALSPDGRRVAYAARPGQWDIWVHDLVGNTTLRVTNDSESDFYPAWTPDGNTLLFTKGNTATSTRVWAAKSPSFAGAEITRGRSATMSPSGELMYQTPTGAIDYLPPSAGTAPATFVPVTAANVQSRPRFSPDGQWVAYSSSESGRNEVYIRRFPSGADRLLASRNGGLEARWRKDGRELYYLENDTVMAVKLDLNSKDKTQAAQPLFSFSGVGPDIQYDVASDGQRFVVSRPVNNAATNPSLVLVQNWRTGLDGKAR